MGIVRALDWTLGQRRKETIMRHTVEEFAAIVRDERRTELRKRYRDSDQWTWEMTQVRPGKVYTKVDTGPEHNMSGKYMVDTLPGSSTASKATARFTKATVTAPWTP